MRRHLSLTVLFAVLMLAASQAAAQETASAAQTAENLRTQLRDVQWKEADLRVRLTQLDYDLKPENIERYFAGFGSTRPEELREQRRVQLQGEKDAIVAQIKSLDESKVRLESAIQRADSLAYQQSAVSPASLMVTQVWHSHKGLVLGGGVVLFGLVGLCSFALIVLRRRSQAR
jgi:hypothetical protein